MYYIYYKIYKFENIIFKKYFEIMKLYSNFLKENFKILFEW